MSALELICDPADNDLWVLEGVGTLLRTGWISRAATAEAGGRSWQIERYGWVRKHGFRATDRTGAVVGELQNTFMRPGETLRWGDRELALREHGQRGGYELLDGERRLATMTPKRPHKRPLDIMLVDEALDPGLVLFVGFIVQAYADDASFSDSYGDGGDGGGD